jgi:two-component system OmpR family sensor kinase/two-component system sensor histidine kinase BaeS
MTNRLWFRLFSAFALVIGVGVLVTVVLARQGAATRFAHFMVDSHMVRPEQLQRALAAYYSERGNWAGLDAQLAAVVEMASDGTMSDMMGSMMGMYDNRIQVVDIASIVVADSDGPAAGQSLPGHQATHSVQSWPIVVGNTEVGDLLVEGAMMVGGSAHNDSLLAGVTRAVLLAGLTAGVVGLLLAGLLVRQITRPLISLTHASSRITAGDLGVRVPVQSKDELGELGTTFNQMASSLEMQETLRRNLMADIAHELRTPLTGIQGTVEALQDGIFPASAENLTAIHEQVMLLNHLVEDLRTLANAEAGQLALDQLPLDLVDLCQRRLNAFQPQATTRQIDLMLHVDVMPLLICGDEQRLGQVLNNLLDNALRHTPPGGAVQVCLGTRNGAVRLVVTDDGEGIAPGDLPYIFDRFYRADASRSRRTGGSGLGLAIARQLVQAQGGRIWAESPPAGHSRGSAFLLELPRLG